MKKFKVGDRVIEVGGFGEVGEVVTVIADDMFRLGYGVQWPNSWGPMYYSEAHLKLVPPILKFKVGDRVVSRYRPKRGVGMVVEIDTTNDSPALYKVGFSDGSRWWHFEQNLELAPPEKLTLEKMYADFTKLWALGVAGEFTDASSKGRVCREKVGNYLNGCPACQYVSDHEIGCDECPLDWDGEGNCGPLSSFWHWRHDPTRENALRVFKTPLKKKILPETRFGTGPAEMLIDVSEPKIEYPWYGELFGAVFRYDAHGEDGVCVSGVGTWKVGATRPWVHRDCLTPCDPPTEETFTVGDTIEFGGGGVYIITHAGLNRAICVDPETGNGAVGIFSVKDKKAIRKDEISPYIIKKLQGKWKFEAE